MSEAFDDSEMYLTRNKGSGEIQFDTGDPDALEAELQRWVTGVERLREQQRGLVEKTMRDAEELRRRASTPPEPPISLAPVRTVAQSPPVETMPTGGDTARLQGAPDVAGAPQTEVVLNTAPQSTQPLVSSRAPSHSHFDQLNPVLAEDIANLVATPPVDFDDFVERLKRNDNEPGERHPTHAAPTARKPVTDADPVDLASGAFTLSVTDLTVPTPSIPIAMSRSYRSGRPYFGPFGYGWDHPYNVYLRELNDGGFALWTGQLREEHFVRTGGSLQPETGFAATLDRSTGPGEGYSVRFPGGTEWLFERPATWSHPERIPLVAIRDRFGNFVRLTYGAIDRVVSVLDDGGRGLLFHYGSCELLERVTDHAGAREVRYEHDPEVEHLVRVVLPATMQYPEGLCSWYEYACFDPHPAMRHNILRVLDASRRCVVENEYAGPDRLWEFNCVVQQRVGVFEYQFGYEQVQYVAPDTANVNVLATRTIVRRPDGSLHTYTFNYRGDLLDHRFRLVRDGSFRVVARQWLYDVEGNNVESIAPDGMRELFHYDSSNMNPCARQNLLRVEHAAPLSGIFTSRTVYEAEYEPQYQLPTLTRDETGAPTTLVYDLANSPLGGTGRLVRVELPSVVLADGSTQQSVVRFDVDQRGLVTAVTSAEGHRSNLRYVAGGIYGGMLAAVENVLSTSPSSITAFSRDAAGFVDSIEDPGGSVTRLTRNSLGQVERLDMPTVDGKNGIIRRWFDDSGRIVRSERPAGSYAPTLKGDIAIVDTSQPDESGSLTVVTLGANTPTPRVTRRRMDHEDRVTSAWDPNGTRTDRLFGEDGALLTETSAAGEIESAQASFRYDRAGRLTRSTDAAGAVTDFEYDAWGRPRKITLPTGGIQVFTWGACDRLMEERVEERTSGALLRILQKQTYSYDSRGRLTSTSLWSFRKDLSTAVPLTVSYLHDRDDRRVEVTLPRGTTQRFAYDQLNRVTSLAPTLGASYDMSYDVAGDLTSCTRSMVENGVKLSRNITLTYDARHRLVRYGSLTSFATFDYDDRGHETEVREVSGDKSRSQFDSYGQLTERVVDPEGLALRTQFEYDSNGLLARFVDPMGQQTTWTRDRLGRTTVFQPPEGAPWKYSTNLTSHTVRQESPSGNQLLLHCPPGPSQPVTMSTVAATGHDGVPPQTISYDGLGRLLVASVGGASVSRKYDSLGRVIEESARGKNVSREYDDLAGSEDLVFPDGRRERTSFDPDGRPTRVLLVTPGSLGGTAGTVLLTIGYSAAGRAVHMTYSNGVEAQLVYDDNDRLIRVEYVRAGVLLDSCRLRYDTRGHLAIVQYLGRPPRNTLHVFDGNGRVVETRSGFTLAPLSNDGSPSAQAADVAAAWAASPASSVLRFTLDASDTRRAKVGLNVGGLDETYAASLDHRIVAIGSDPVTYTADGVRNLDSRYRYELDALGRVSRVFDRTTAALLVELQYDALGRAASGTIEGRTFERLYDAVTPVEEVDGTAPGMSRQFSPHPLWPAPLSVVDGAGDVFVHQDAGWSTMCVTDAAGAVLERHRYDVFGASTVLANDGVTPLAKPRTERRWRGMPGLGHTDLYSTPARLYDPHAGVFTAKDPLLYIDSPSPYAFAGHNPVDFGDLTGFGKAPLGNVPPPEARTGITKWLYEDSMKGGWRHPPREGDLFEEKGAVDTGSILGNYAINSWISLSNMVASVINVPFEFAHDIDDAMKHSPFAVEWAGPMQSMMPLMETMGLAVKTAGTLTYLQALAPSIGEVNQVAKSLALSASGVGMGGVLLPGRRASNMEYVGKTPVMGESSWAMYQKWATGSRFEAFFRLFRNGRVRDVLADWLENGYIVEAKFGNMGQMWDPAKEAQILAQARAYLEIMDAFGLKGVRYMVSTERGAYLLRQSFRREFRNAVTSRQLRIWWVPPPPK